MRTPSAGFIAAAAFLLASASLLSSAPQAKESEAAGCKDHPLFTRMPLPHLERHQGQQGGAGQESPRGARKAVRKVYGFGRTGPGRIQSKVG